VPFLGIAVFSSSTRPIQLFLTLVLLGSWIQTSNFVLLLSIPWFDCDESLTCRGLNSNSGHFVVLPLSLFRLENRVCLSRGVHVAGAA
jgi:hypothetical protein